MREPAPSYVGEGPHALWHVSENPSIERFEPHVSATASSREPRVWAVDTRHQPLYWFPRQCPRATFWAAPHTTPADEALLGGATRVHLVEERWWEQLLTTTVFAYRLPEETFARDPDVGGYWLSRDAVTPLEVLELGDLVGTHGRARIELRALPSLWPVWTDIAGSTLEYSGIRLHNALAPGTRS